ncbi:hypothetical protein AVEN_111653-1 [Araneus ventricosus]|uniref:Secreted protein n=1 Tax=Araneus ventricosus TaxID=182803 RepID=A0A4Y2C460_ARAVE|nr:hypothetical protein AVEN_111653-1 [Araneus ventricosus]
MPPQGVKSLLVMFPQLMVISKSMALPRMQASTTHVIPFNCNKWHSFPAEKHFPGTHRLFRALRSTGKQQAWSDSYRESELATQFHCQMILDAQNERVRGKRRNGLGEKERGKSTCWNIYARTPEVKKANRGCLCEFMFFPLGKGGFHCEISVFVKFVRSVF